MERCRFCNCLKSCEFCENIFDNKQTDPTIPTIVELFTNLKIVENDSYGKFICFNCFHILIVFYHYREKILETNQLLQNETENKQNNVEDFHKNWPRIEQCDDGQFVVYNNVLDEDCKTNLRLESDLEEIGNQCPSSLIGDKKKKKVNNNSNENLHDSSSSSVSGIKSNIDELCSRIKHEFDDEDQTVGENDQHSNISIDNKDKNCLYSEESLGFIKYEIDIEGTRFKIECDSAYEDNQYLTSLISDKKKLTDNDNNDELCSRIVAGSVKNPGINKNNRSIDDNQDKRKDNNESSDNEIYNIIVLNEPQTDRKRYQCNICYKSISSKSNLRKHILRHNGEKHFKCNICDKKLSAKSVLKRHLLIHTGEKAHQCNICDMKFTYRGDLKRHLYVHTGERPYQCDICNKSFKQKGTLKIHLLQHTGEKPYQCNICNNKFSQKGHLTEHFKIHTVEKKVHQCCICDVKFRHKVHLKDHLTQHTDEGGTLSLYKL